MARTTDQIAKEIVGIAITHGGSTDEARLAMDNLLMDEGPAAVQAAGQLLQEGTGQ
jgi:hypothetical protein